MLALLALSLGLAMDAFAVSLVRGSVGERRPLRALELGLAFGLAQGLMPLVGWGLGLAFAESFQAFDHWIAFILLTVLGGRMLIEAAAPGEEGREVGRHGRLLGLAVAAFATSVDAAAAGLTLPLFAAPIPLSCLAIGLTTFVLCTLGYWLGGRVSPQGGRLAELLGGLALIGLGAKILIEHLGG